MTLLHRIAPFVLLAALAATGCAPAAGQPGPGEGGASPRADQSRVLVFVGRVEPAHLLAKVQVSGSGAASQTTKRLFNAALTTNDDREVPLPLLAERLPELNTESWRVFPDGRMETIYRLKAATWHDGTPLAAEDFVFSWKVLVDPQQGGFSPVPQGRMQEVLAPDPRTVVIRWNQPYPEAGTLGTDFPPLPRHVLESSFEKDRGDAFLSHSFFTREYVGLGPYKLERWEPGAFLEGAAFNGYVLGRPKIDRVKVLFAGDLNTALANILADAAHVAIDESIRFQQGMVLKREWVSQQRGTIILNPSQVRYVQIQWRPQFMNPTALADLRVRQAFAHAIDKQALADGLLDGEGKGTDTMLSPLVEFYPAVERVLTRYPYDLRRTQQLMGDAGFARAADGLYATGGQRLSPELRTIAGVQEEQEMAILENGWRTAGIDPKPYVLPVAQSQDGQILASFPALATATSGGVEGTDTLLKKIAGINAPDPENRWRGSNLGGWAHPEYDRLYDVFTSALDRSDRNQAIVQMMKLVSEELPVFTLYHNFTVSAYVAGLQGPTAEGLSAWRVHEWSWKS